MVDLERLKILARAGDKDAAERLLILSERRADAPSAALASLTLGDAERLVTQMTEAWSRQDWERCAEQGRLLGFHFSRELAYQLDARLQDKRPIITRRIHATPQPERRLSRSDALLALFEARTHHTGAGWRAAGPGAFHRPAQVTLAVRHTHPDHGLVLVLGVGWSCSRSSTPGTAFHDLRPWRSDMTANQKRLQAGWLQSPERTRLTCLDDAPGVVQSLAAEARDPFHRLETLLESPSEKHFKAIQRLLARWPHPPSQARALTHAREHLDAHWPNAFRSGGRGWLKAASRGPLPEHQQLVTRLEATFRQPQVEILANLERPLSVRDLIMERDWTCGHYHENLRVPEFQNPLAACFESEALRGIKRIELRWLPIGEKAWHALLTSPVLEALEDLVLKPPFPLDPKGPLPAPRWPHLRSLTLDYAIYPPRVWGALITQLPRLEHLTLRRMRFHPRSLDTLKSLTTLRTLHLQSAKQLYSEEIEAICQSLGATLKWS